MDSSTDNLIIKTETYAQIAEPAPFSLKGLKETLTRPLIYYEKFVNVNGSAIEGIESSLRSLSYILPGRFKDSEFVSEILFSLLNLFRHYNDLLLGNLLDRSMSLHQRNLLAYLKYLKSRHPLMKSLITILNLLKIVQIPLEMIVAKFTASNQKSIFILVVELSKFVLKFGIWQGSGWRLVPGQLSVPLERKDHHFHQYNNQMQDNNYHGQIKNLESKMSDLDFQLKDQNIHLKEGIQQQDPLKAYLKGHKSNIYTSQPQLTFSPCLDWKSWTRELTHLARPSVYALSLGLFMSRGGVENKKTILNWAPLIISLTMDIYSKWPELNQSPLNINNNQNSNISPIEAEERSRRLLDFLYYPFRNGPLYESITAEALDGIETKIGSWKFLMPVVETVKIYRKLCENVYFYTSAS